MVCLCVLCEDLHCYGGVYNVFHVRVSGVLYGTFSLYMKIFAEIQCSVSTLVRRVTRYFFAHTDSTVPILTMRTDETKSSSTTRQCVWV